jgi:hypothetical protein
MHSLEVRAAGICARLEAAVENGDAPPASGFGALLYRIHHFDHTETFMDPAPPSPEPDGAYELHWGPGMENITFQDDWQDDFNFAVAVFGKDAYQFEHAGEEVPGAVAHYLARVAVLSRWLRQLSRLVRDAPRFKAVPKTEPFRFIVASVPRDDVPVAFFIDL